MNYATTKKEFLAVVFAVEKFLSYLINFEVIIFTNHAALKHLLKSSNSMSHLIQQMVLPKECCLEIQDKVDHENIAVDHLSCLGTEVTPIAKLPIDDSSLDDQLLATSHQSTLWYTNLVNYKVL